MSITFTDESIFKSTAKFLVCPTNIYGVMGAGLAKQFARYYPGLEPTYRQYCEEKQLLPGMLWCYHGMISSVLCFPTKTDWHRPSKMDYIVAGLITFSNTYNNLHGVYVTSVAFPKLGCGLGGLDWEKVKPVMVRYLSECDIPVYIHE